MDPTKHHEAVLQPYNSPQAPRERRLIARIVVISIIAFLIAAFTAILNHY